MLKSLCSIIVLMMFTASAAAAQSPLLAKIMTDSQLDEVVGGDGCFTPVTTTSTTNSNTKSKGGATKTAAKTGAKGKAKGKNRIKGNNGWGNGADPSNPGSGSGKTAPSKTANGTAGPGVNTNPTRSTGR